MSASCENTQSSIPPRSPPFVNPLTSANARWSLILYIIVFFPLLPILSKFFKFVSWLLLFSWFSKNLDMINILFSFIDTEKYRM
jgi:hypothetical protein